MSERTRSSMLTQYPAGAKLYRKTLKSRFGTHEYKAHFDVESINDRRRTLRKQLILKKLYNHTTGE